MSDQVLSAIIGGATAVIVAVIGLVGFLLNRRITAVHLLINSRMDQLLLLAATAARAEGVAAGEQSQRDRAAPSDERP